MILLLVVHTLRSNRNELSKFFLDLFPDSIPFLTMSLLYFNSAFVFLMLITQLMMFFNRGAFANLMKLFVRAFKIILKKLKVFDCNYNENVSFFIHIFEAYLFIPSNCFVVILFVRNFQCFLISIFVP